VTDALDAAPAGPLRVISMCAGDARDLLPPLAAHPRRADVAARLVELDPRNAAAARAAAASAGLEAVDVVVGDAALTDRYAGFAPADLVLACGIFGNVCDADIRRTVRACAALCRTGGRVIWTRHRRPPDAVPGILAWFAEAGFELDWLSAPGLPFGVGMHRFAGRPVPLPAGRRLFSFRAG
jgi:SAM-dependent methyltransferase